MLKHFIDLSEVMIYTAAMTNGREHELDPELLTLSLDGLVSRHADLKSQADEIAPMLDKHEKLEESAYLVEQVIALRHIEQGIASLDDVNTVILGAVLTPKLHDGVKLWLTQISTSDKVSVIGLDDWHGGSSEYCLVPFSIDVSQGYDQDLIDTVTAISEFLLPKSHFDLTFRVNDERLYLLIRQSEEAIVAAVSEYHYLIREPVQTIAEAVKEATESYPIAMHERITTTAANAAYLDNTKAHNQGDVIQADNTRKGFWSFLRG